jgi:XapX domain-containing protein
VPYLKALFAGVLVGVLYVVVRRKSPAPPPIALVGLLGMLLGQAVLETR